ncbi:ATP-binding protein [Methanosarcinales archaeon]|nr:MAG: ATP-binding protein [Methanosarcinales archaeon]
MKILICGKGGSGKSTVSALLARSMAKRGRKVLVIDTDESNFGLHRQLGMELPPDFMNRFGGKQAMTERLREAFRRGEAVNVFDQKWEVDSIPDDYIHTKDGVKLLAIGKIHDFGEGCACPMGTLSREFLKNLELKDDEVVIVDTDAGIEHFGRGVEDGCDLIIVVVDPSYESLRLSLKIEELAVSIKRPVYFILNKIDDESRGIMLESLNRERVAGEIPSNREIFKASLEGRELDMRLDEVESLVDKLSMET